MDIRDRIRGDGFVLLDGAMGTMLQKAGLKPGEQPERMLLEHPERVAAIHRAYAESGAMVVCANTFGASALKLQGTGLTPEEVIHAAVACAKGAVSGSGCAVALDIGPLGELLEPAGSLSFGEAYEHFARQIRAGVQAGAELITIETMTDLYEVRAALLAAKENSALPVLASMSFEKTGRTFTGCTPSALALTLGGLGADALGVNCSLAPGELVQVIRELRRYTALPLIVKANAGLPDPRTGEYNIGPEAFAEQALACAAAGAVILGGCCGTTPAYIRVLADRLADAVPLGRERTTTVCAVCTPTKTVEIDGVRVIGERINPTGKKRFQQALREEDTGYILAQAMSQTEAGADILDINVGLPGIDEAAVMARTVQAVQAVCEAPLQLDSASPEALEAGLRIYGGKAIVNSVSGEAEKLARVLPLVKKYGAAVVGLTLDENGIPDTARERVRIAQRILDAALALGIPREDVYIDCLTLTVCAQQEGALQTLEAIREVRGRLGLRTVLGVSNISFGLPEREQVNAAFLTLAMDAGLNLPILNPNAERMMGAVASWRVLCGADVGAGAYVARYADAAPSAAPAPARDAACDIAAAIARGLCDESRRATKELLAKTDAMQVISGHLIPALDAVGVRFERGEAFLPQLLQAAQAAQAAFDVVKAQILAAGQPLAEKGPIVVATVQGDIHDIGKNIVKIILENYGYRVVDLGRDVAPERVVRAALEQGARLVGLSALMTTTLPAMEETIRRLRAEVANVTVFVGGAVLTPDYAARIGADFYARDAKAAVDIAKKVLE